MRPVSNAEKAAQQGLGRDGRTIAAAARLAISGSYASIPSLFQTAAYRADAAIPALSAVRSILARTPLHRWVDLDGLMRRSVTWYAFDIDRWMRSESDANHALVAALASMSASGRTRETAVRRLGSSLDDVALGFILVRLNDWVPAVREAARDALELFLSRGRTEAIVRSMALVVRVKSGGRLDPRALDSLERELCSTSARSAVEAACRDTDVAVRRAAFEFLARADRIVAATRALSDSDGHTRLWGARLLAATDDEAARERLCAQRTDRFMPLRCLVITSMLARTAEPVPTFLRAALFDTHPAIRDLARFEITQRSAREDFAAEYRSKLDETSDTVVSTAIQGLGECGEPIDAAMIEPFCSHPRASMRRHALVALTRLDPARAAGRLHDALLDASDSVAKLAVRLFRSGGPLLDFERIAEVARSEPRPGRRALALELIARRGSRWQSLPHLLAACGDPSRDVVAAANDLLVRWLGAYNRSFTAPSRAQRSAIADALTLHGNAIPARIRGQISAALRTW